MSSISPIGGGNSIQPIQFPSLNGTGATSAPQGANTEFGNSIANALDSLQGADSKSDSLAAQMAVGQGNISDYMIAANEAEIATQMTVAVRNKAVDAYNQIMQMQV